MHFLIILFIIIFPQWSINQEKSQIHIKKIVLNELWIFFASQISKEMQYAHNCQWIQFRFLLLFHYSSALSLFMQIVFCSDWYFFLLDFNRQKKIWHTHKEQTEEQKQ